MVGILDHSRTGHCVKPSRSTHDALSDVHLFATT